MTITILTPTFNRGHFIQKLYESLKNQTCKDFEWLIVDDGSTDDTKEIVNEFSQDDFNITYVNKPNGGKHTAINFSYPYIKGILVAIVDSDDTLDINAIEIIKKDWQMYTNKPEIGMLNYMRKSFTGSNISEGEEGKYIISDDITYRVNKNIKGDRFEVIRTDVLRKYLFPVFEGENFMGEGWLWKKIAMKYKTVYINRAIYNCEYLPGGLSQSGRLFRMQNPFGMMENCKGFMIPQVAFKVKLKEILLFGTYGFCANLSCKEIVKRSTYHFLQIILLVPSFILFKYWSKVNGFKNINK